MGTDRFDRNRDNEMNRAAVANIRAQVVDAMLVQALPIEDTLGP